MKLVKVSNKTGKSTEKTETFKFIHKTAFAIEEKRRTDTRTGQREVWTAKKGETNIFV